MTCRPCRRLLEKKESIFIGKTTTLIRSNAAAPRTNLIVGKLQNPVRRRYLAYWDALLKRNLGLRIDSRASGGRRNDLETLGRAVPLWRSDYIFEPISRQVRSYGMALWAPFFVIDVQSFRDYETRSLFVPYIDALYDVRVDDSDWDIVRKNLNLWREYVVPYYAADYYPLTRVSLDRDVWIAWQYNVEDKGEGVVQAFRRRDSKTVASRFPLKVLDTSAVYRVKDLDSGKIREP